MSLQESIHKMTEGAGARWMAALCGVIAMIALAVWYNLAAFKNLATVDAMDAAQLARNLAEGRGYTTDFIRPLSLHLLKRHQSEGQPLVVSPHPDLSNPPAYPAFLAVALKLNPFGWPNVVEEKGFSMFRPDLWIAFCNQALFLLAAILVYRFARGLFDPSVGWISTTVFVGSELFWRFSVSGQSTMLLVVLVLLLARRLVRIEEEARHNVRGGGWFVGMGLLVGCLVGATALTRYSLGLLILPVAIFLGTVPGPRKNSLALLAVVGFALTLGPWVARNVAVSGTPFGTAGYLACEGTSVFPDPHQLERSLSPDYTGLTGGEIWSKALHAWHEIIAHELPRLGGSWVTALFLVGLLVPFRNPTLGRVRWLVVGSLAILAVAQGVGKTALSTESPDVNSENLLVVMAPIVFIFGVGLFYTLLEPIAAPIDPNRLFYTGTFCVVACLPLIFSLFQPVRSHVSYPPYYPPWLQDKGSLVGNEDWIMTDIPWAMAWYGRRPSVWLSLKYRQPDDDRVRNDFAATAKLHPIRALHLSAQKTKAIEVASLTDWIYRERDEDWDKHVRDWDSFVLVGPYVQREVPAGFPLRKAPRGLLPEIFLLDSERREEKAIQSK